MTRVQKTNGVCIALTAVVLGLAVAGFSADRLAGAEKTPAQRPQETAEDRDPNEALPTLDEARMRAALLHDAYESTLRALHRHYFRDDGKQPVPSRVLEDVFLDVARRSKTQARWIAVNAQVMSLGHEPQDDFEKQAARQLAAGKDYVERAENGVYRRAGGIVLFASCLKCHAPAPMRADGHRVAGLVISVPMKKE